MKTRLQYFVAVVLASSLLVTPVATALSRNIAFVLLAAVSLVSLISLALHLHTQDKLASNNILNKISFPTGPLALGWLGFVLFAAASLVWTPELQRGAGAWIQSTSAAIATMVCLLAARTDPGLKRWLHWGLILSLVTASCVILFELANGSAIRMALGGTNEPFRLNRAAVAVAIMSPLLFISRDTKQVTALKLGVFGLVWSAVFLSNSEAAKLSIIVASLVLLLSFAIHASLLLRLVGLAVLVSHLLAPLIALYAYDTMPQDFFDWIGHPDHRIRLLIWASFSLHVPEAFIFGHGIQASSHAYITHADAAAELLPGFFFVHPHNFSIQIWYELGLVGVLTTATLFAACTQRLQRLQYHSKIAASALIASIWTVMYVSHGAWQHWWWALVGIVSILFAFLIKINQNMVRI